MPYNMPPEDQPTVLTELMLAYFHENFAQLPTLSSHASQVIGIAGRALQANIQELVLLVRSDPLSSAELLRIANSSVYRRSQVVETINDAIVRLGRQEVYAIILSLATRGLFEPQLQQIYYLLPNHWYRLQHHAVFSAFASGWLSHYLKLDIYEAAFLGGMFHDIGKLGALYCLSGLLLHKKIPFHVSFLAAAQAMENLHVEIGKQMLVNWQLQPHVVDTCLLHHDNPDTLTERVAHQHLRALHIVRIASALDILHDHTFVPSVLYHELQISLEALHMTDHILLEIAPKLEVINSQVTKILKPDV